MLLRTGGGARERREGAAVADEVEITSARALDALYQRADKVYYEFARGCGLSETAYWILYALEVSGGSATQSDIAEEFSFSRQTVNSALKTLESRGLVALAPAEGSRRAKLVTLTASGRAFSDERIVPAIEAEDRAFSTLSPEERAEFLRLAAAYTAAIDREIREIAGGAVGRRCQGATGRRDQGADEPAPDAGKPPAPASTLHAPALDRDTDAGRETR